MDLYYIDIIGPVRHPQLDLIHIDSTTMQSQNCMPILQSLTLQFDLAVMVQYFMLFAWYEANMKG